MYFYDKETFEAIARGEVSEAALAADHEAVIDAIVEDLRSLPSEDPSKEVKDERTEEQKRQDFLDFIGLS